MKLLAARNLFGLLGRRAREVGQPGLTVYAEAGAQVLDTVGAEIRDKAYANEQSARGLAARLKTMLADGKISPAEQAELAQAPAALERQAERSHDITEAVQ